MYREHMELRRGRDGARERLLALMLEKEALFQRTQPGAIRYDTVKVLTSNDASPLEDYVTRVEFLDYRIDDAQRSLEQWDFIVDEHLTQLRKSRDIDDIIYVMRFIDRKPVKLIARKLNYSARWVYARIQKMKSAN